jgi:O-antigen ligase
LKVKKRWVTVGAIAAVLVSVPVYVTFSNRNADDLSGSSGSRMNYIVAGLKMAAKNPIFGVGFAEYQDSFESYASSFDYEYGKRTAHNSWILVVSETGWLGLLLFSLVFFYTFRSARSTFDLAPEFLLALVSYGVAMTFLSHSYLLYPYLLYAIIATGERLSKDPRASKAGELLT